VRIVAVALLALALAGSASGGSQRQRVAFVHAGDLVVVDLATGTRTVVLRQAPLGPVAWSGDGKLLSDGPVIVGGPTLATGRIVWAPEGETAAYQTSDGAVHLWTPSGGSRTIVLRSWGARSLAWGPNGELALGRKATPGEGPRAHQEVWVWRDGTLRRVVGPLPGDTTPIVEGFAPDGRVLWWNDLFDSGSIASDGLVLSANTQPLATTLIHPDFVSVCGSHLVYAKGRDRYTTKGKSIVFDGRDISLDGTRSWVSPSCNAAGFVAAAAGRNWWEHRIGQGELRSIWELAPKKQRLTHPPAGWTDEYPRVLDDGSVLFVRTHQTLGDGAVTEHASLDRYTAGRVTPIASLTTKAGELSPWEPNYYGHYGWPQLLAVSA
jgi:hypothetical protein